MDHQNPILNQLSAKGEMLRYALVYAKELERRKSRQMLFTLYPEVGQLRRELYPRHMEFFAAGASYRERLAMCANRIGKTFGMGGYETALHLTGLYPEWWVGRRFDKPVRWWAAGKTNETTRDIIQRKLFGDVVFVNRQKTVTGTGLVPGDSVGNITWKQGVADLIDTVQVKHKSGGWSLLGLKSYQQGRGSFEGTDLEGCIAAGQLVQMADGTMRPIEHIVPGDFVLSINREGTASFRRVVAVHDNGVKDCIRITPRYGTPMVLTPDHDVYYGYRLSSKVPAEFATKVAQLRPGTFWPCRTKDKEDAWYIWAALVVTSGDCARQIVAHDDEALMLRAIDALPPEAGVRRRNFKRHTPEWHLYWNAFWSCMPVCLPREQRLPDWVWTSSKQKVALFLRWLFAVGGRAHKGAIEYFTESEWLVSELTVLLCRMGVMASVRQKNVKWRGSIRRRFFVYIKYPDDVARFIDGIGIEGKDSVCARTKEEVLKLGTANRGAKRAGHYRMRESRASTVLSVESVGARHVYDLSVDSEHRYFVGSNLVSNCWLDEEPPLDIYGECLIRTATTDGVVMMTFTPLDGMTETVMQFLPSHLDIEALSASEVAPSKYLVIAGWNDVPHLSEQAKAELLAATPDYLRDARSRGLPTLGSGAVFQVPEDQIKCDPFPIPAHWPRVCGIDFGWDHPTAAVWIAWDRDSDTKYIYDCYAQSKVLLPLHAAAIRDRGQWIPVAWPHDGYQVKDAMHGEQLAQQYRDNGVNMMPIHAQFEEVTGVDRPQSLVSVEAGVQLMHTEFQTGKLKVFSHLSDWFTEYRLYRRESGRIVKLLDDRLCATRYARMMLRFAECEPASGVSADLVDEWRKRRYNWRVM